MIVYKEAQAINFYRVIAYNKYNIFFDLQLNYYPDVSD